MPQSHNRAIRRSGVLGSLLLSVFVSGSCVIANAQQSATNAAVDRDRGIELYKAGENRGAIKILKEVVKKRSGDADAWYFLGLAYYSDDSIGLARDAFEHLLSLRPDSAEANAKLAYALILADDPVRATAAARHAIELGDQSAEPHYAIAEASFRAGEAAKAIEEADRALQIKPSFALALITRGLAHRSLNQYAEAASSLERFLTINPADPDNDVWRSELDRLRNFGPKGTAATSSSTTGQTPPDLPMSGREVSTRARILEKPEPSYTEAARKAGVTGTVVMRCVFASDGEVRNLVVMKALAYGLTSKAVEAARKIRFVPATKDGRPASMFMQLEYNFNLY